MQFELWHSSVQTGNSLNLKKDERKESMQELRICPTLISPDAYGSGEYLYLPALTGEASQNGATECPRLPVTQIANILKP